MFAAAAGYRNATATAATTTNDDAVLVILPLGGTGTEFAAAVPFSTTADDRFWAVTFDANNKIVAAGYVTEGTDQLAGGGALQHRRHAATRPSAPAASPRSTPPSAEHLEEARGVVVQSDGKIVIGGIRRALVSAGDVSSSADRRRRAGDGRVWRRRSGATQDAAPADVAVTVDAATDGGADASGDSPSAQDAAADAAPDDVPANFVAIAPCPDPGAYAAAAQVSTTADNRYSPACARVAAGATLTIEASAAHPRASARGRLGRQSDPGPERPRDGDVPDAGFYPFLCPEHVDEGMVGVVWVE